MVGSAVAPTLWDYQPEARRPDRTGVRYGAHPGGESSLDAGGELRSRVTLLGGDGTTLDHTMTHRWEQLMGHRAIACPWCQGEMRPRYSETALPVGARCVDCGAVLS